MNTNFFNRLIQRRYKLFLKRENMTAWGGVIIRKFITVYLSLVSSFIRWYYHCEIPIGLDITGCYFCHYGFGTVINARTVLGKNIEIQHSVTIGENSRGVPKIGNDVFIGARTVIIGDIKIGNNVKIGAGSVVVNDVPDNCTVVGVPAKVVNK